MVDFLDHVLRAVAVSAEAFCSRQHAHVDTSASLSVLVHRNSDLHRLCHSFRGTTARPSESTPRNAHRKIKIRPSVQHYRLTTGPHTTGTNTGDAGPIWDAASSSGVACTLSSLSLPLPPSPTCRRGGQSHRCLELVPAVVPSQLAWLDLNHGPWGEPSQPEALLTLLKSLLGLPDETFKICNTCHK